MQKTIKIDGMTCAHCANSVKVALEDIPGITNVDVNVRAGQATVDRRAEACAASEAGSMPPSAQISPR